MFCYQLQNVSKNSDEAINDFLSQENESFNTGERLDYFQESSEDEDKVDDSNYSKKIKIL